MELYLNTFIWAPLYSCIHWLRPRNSHPPLHLGSYSRSLLVSQERRRHLFVTRSDMDNVIMQLPTLDINMAGLYHWVIFVQYASEIYSLYSMRVKFIAYTNVLFCYGLVNENISVYHMCINPSQFGNRVNWISQNHCIPVCSELCSIYSARNICRISRYSYFSKIINRTKDAGLPKLLMKSYRRCLQNAYLEIKLFM
jgi:hypothetical protein